ncbi:hypothetical protein EDB84DRAFT_1515359 [Lactarius hengduanensis]|nr:hypothetical protein EDB84DRAFT_1515359 [Lactarius hengduanensis]
MAAAMVVAMTAAVERAMPTAVAAERTMPMAVAIAAAMAVAMPMVVEVMAMGGMAMEAAKTTTGRTIRKNLLPRDEQKES